MAPQPAVKQEWIDALNAIRDHAVVDEVSLRRIEREATAALKTADSLVRLVALQVLGVAAAMRGNVRRTRERFDEAFRISTGSVVVRNYISALQLLGLFDDSRRVALDMIQRFPDEVDVLCVAVMAFAQVGDLIAVDALLQRLRALNKSDRVTTALPDVDAFVLKATRLQVTSDDIAQRFEVALGALRALGLRVRGTASSQRRSGELSLRFLCEADTATLVKANFAIANAIVTEFEEPLDDLITFGTLPSRGVFV
jgi:hypothetical protein